jgi:predicted helicase
MRIQDLVIKSNSPVADKNKNCGIADGDEVLKDFSVPLRSGRNDKPRQSVDGAKNDVDSRLHGNDKGGTFGPEDVLAYIYGIFHSPEYRKRYAEFLKIDFPRVPMPGGKDIFVKICGVGHQLIKLHLLEAKILDDERQWPKFNVKGSGIVEKGYPSYVKKADENGRVYINSDQYFDGVEPEVWEFCIGGYQVCEKWLKDRRERTLSYDEQNHYQKIVVTLRETGRLMQEKCSKEFFEKE